MSQTGRQSLFTVGASGFPRRGGDRWPSATLPPAAAGTSSQRRGSFAASPTLRSQPTRRASGLALPISWAQGTTPCSSRRPLGPCELVREDRGRRALGTGDSGRPLPEVVAVQLLSAVPVVLAVRALASGKLKPASRSGQEGSMANLQEAGTGWVTRSPPRRTHTEATAALRRRAGRGRARAPSVSPS